MGQWECKCGRAGTNDVYESDEGRAEVDEDGVAGVLHGPHGLLVPVEEVLIELVLKGVPQGRL